MILVQQIYLDVQSRIQVLVVTPCIQLDLIRRLDEIIRPNNFFRKKQKK